MIKLWILGVILLLEFCSPALHAATDNVIWKGIYHQGIPFTNKVSVEYCKQHTPGTFVHSVANMLAHGVTTLQGIHLDNATFHEHKNWGIYFITGDLTSHGLTANTKWEDSIHYTLFKFSEQGITRGIWTTKECIGLYTGSVVNALSI